MKNSRNSITHKQWKSSLNKWNKVIKEIKAHRLARSDFLAGCGFCEAYGEVKIMSNGLKGCIYCPLHKQYICARWPAHRVREATFWLLYYELKKNGTTKKALKYATKIRDAIKALEPKER